MKKIKVLQIVPNMQQGGLENLIMNILRNIDRDKFEVHFLYHYTAEFFFDKEIIQLGGIIHKCSFREDNNIIRYLFFLNDFFKNNHFDVIHSHMLSTSYFTFKYARKNGCKVLINHAHNSTTEKSIKGFLKKCMVRIASKNANVLLACSKEAGKFAFKNKEFKVIKNCIDINKFKYSIDKRQELRKQLNIKENEIVIGNIGRLNVQKNQKFLIEVFSNISRNDLKLLIIGAGELKNDIENLINRLNLFEKVILISNVDSSSYYSVFDYFVLCSEFEGFPLTAVEAQANGCTCLFSDVITQDVKINDNVEFLSLNKQEWVNYLNESQLNSRNIIKEKIEEYDIKTIIEEISKIYLESI